MEEKEVTQSKAKNKNSVGPDIVSRKVVKKLSPLIRGEIFPRSYNLGTDNVNSKIESLVCEIS